MKKTKILALILVVCTLLTIPSFAAEPRASEQIHMHLVYAVAEPGQIYVEAPYTETALWTRSAARAFRL